MNEFSCEENPLTPDSQKRSAFNDTDVIVFAWIVYSEMADEGDEEMFMCGSCLYNMFLADRPEEFGSTFDEIGKKKFYAYSGKNSSWQDFYKFIEMDSDWDIRNMPQTVIQKCCKAYKVSIDLLKAFRTPMEGLFYYTDKEQTMLRMMGRFNFNICQQVNRVGKYNVWTYKKEAGHEM